MHRLLATTLALAACSSLHAAPLTTTQSLATGSLSLAVSDTTSGTTAVTQSLSSQSLAFSRFDSSVGVLTGVSSGIAFNAGSLTLSATGTPGTGNPTFASTGSVSVSSNLPGAGTFGPINDVLTNTCSGNGATACFGGGITNLSGNATLTKSDSSWLTSNATSPSNLQDYVGAGSIASNVTITSSVSLSNANRVTNPTATLAFTGLSGTQSLTYSYLRHANASFAGAADTNALTSILTPGSGLSFSVFNLGDSSSTKLDFVGLQCVSGDCGAFNVTLASFQDLNAGSSVSGNATLVSSGVGNHAATYALTFSDDTAIGATASHLTSTLTLNVQGSVAPVPEPAEWTMLLAGLFVVGFMGHRRRQLAR